MTQGKRAVRRDWQPSTAPTTGPGPVSGIAGAPGPPNLFREPIPA